MQKLRILKGSKLVKFLLITVLLLSLLIVVVLAEDYTVKISLSEEEYGVGDNIEVTVSFTNNKNEAEAGALMKAILQRDDITLVNDSVKVKVNDGAWNQAESARTSGVVIGAQDYRYYYDTSAAYADTLLVSLGDIASGDTVTVTYTVHIESNNAVRYYCNFYSNNDTTQIIKTSPVITSTPLTAIVKPTAEKTSRNLTSSGEKANVGDVIEYTIKATNSTSRTNSLWTDVTVTDALPEGVTFLDGTVQIDGADALETKYNYDENTRTLTVFLPDLGPYGSSTLTFCVVIDDDAYGKTISNSAVVSGKDREDSDSEKSVSGNDGDGHTVVSAYIITFNRGQADVTGTMDSQRALENTPVALNACTFARTGYVFAGWSISPDSNVIAYGDQEVITATRDMTLYAVWSLDECTITFDKNAADATGTMEPQAATKDIAVTLSANAFTRAGYVFAGWSTDPNATAPDYADRETITPTGDMTLYAVWANAVYTIKFDKNASDATGTMTDQSVVANISNTLNPNAFARSGYTFAGWGTDRYATAPGYADRETITPTGDMTLYAVWYRSTCTITFDKNATDATGTMNPQEAAINVATTLNANAFTRSGYYFRGWSTSPVGEIAYSDRGSITPTDDITLYAVWGTNPCTITFHKNLDTATGTMEPQIADANVPVALNKNQFVGGNYYFQGWSTDPNSNVIAYVDEEVITPVDDMDLYAVWTPILFTDDHIAYINGYPDGSVRLGNNITRAEAVTIFFRLIDNPEKNDPVNSAFSDIESGMWYTQAVNFMAKMGIVDGYQDGTFRPDQPIKRAEFAKIAAGFDNLADSQGDIFSDVNSNYWGYPYIYSAYEKGWVNGYSDGTFRPERYITRAEVISIVNRMLDRAIGDAALTQVVCPFNDKDITNHWAYKDMLEASIFHEYERDANGKEIWTKW